MLSFCARSLQSFPLAFGASKLLQIFCRMVKGILKAYGPNWVVTLLPGCEQKGSKDLAFC